MGLEYMPTSTLTKTIPTDWHIYGSPMGCLYVSLGLGDLSPCQGPGPAVGLFERPRAAPGGTRGEVAKESRFARRCGGEKWILEEAF